MRIKFFIDQFLLRAATDKNHSSDYKNGKIIKNLLWYISLPEQIGGALQLGQLYFQFFTQSDNSTKFFNGGIFQG